MSNNTPLVTSLNTSNSKSKNNTIPIGSSINTEQTGKKKKKSKEQSGSEDSSIFVDQDGKDVIILEESTKIETFLRKCVFVFSVFFLFWILIVVLLSSTGDIDQKIQDFLEIIFLFVLLLFVANKIAFSIFHRKLRKYCLYFFIFDILLLVVILFGLKLFITKKFKSVVKYYNYIMFFGLASLLNTFSFMASTIIQQSQKFNFFMGFIFMQISSALIFIIPLVPEFSEYEYEILIYLFIVLTCYNIYFCGDLYLVITRMCHKLTEEDYLVFYFFFWTDLGYRFWINLFIRKRRIFDIENKEEEEEDDKNEKIINL
jgi:hypothetical protein